MNKTTLYIFPVLLSMYFLNTGTLSAKNWFFGPDRPSISKIDNQTQYSIQVVSAGNVLFFLDKKGTNLLEQKVVEVAMQEYGYQTSNTRSLSSNPLTLKDTPIIINVIKSTHYSDKGKENIVDGWRLYKDAQGNAVAEHYEGGTGEKTVLMPNVENAYYTLEVSRAGATHSLKLIKTK